MYAFAAKAKYALSSDESDSSEAELRSLNSDSEKYVYAISLTSKVILGFVVLVRFSDS